MKKVLFISLSTLLVFFFIYSCSSDEETTTPNIVQTPEPEAPAPTPIQYTLTVSAGDGGSVSSEGGTYDEGTSVTITATPDEGYEFVGWEGNDSDSNSISLILNTDTSVQAIFSSSESSESDNTTSIYSYDYIELDSPPFGGTIFISGDIITSSDPSRFAEVSYSGIEERQMFDRRNGGAWINIQPYIFNATFSDGSTIEIQVNSEFTIEEATDEAEKYGFLVGQLSQALRKDVETMWIHKGVEAYGGGNNNILIHTGQTEIYEDYGSGIVEETLIHEATHTSIDFYHYPEGLTDGQNWIDATDRDGCYISDYARDYPYREDIAELMPLYIAVKYFPDRITTELRDKVLSCNINRIEYLDSLNMDMSIYEFIDTGISSSTISSVETYSINVTASNSSDYTLSGTDRSGSVSGNDPSVTINAGDTINFAVNSPGHPFYVKTAQGTGTSNLASGVSGNGSESGTVSFTPTSAGTYYYQCSLHNGMYGTIIVQ